VSEVLVGRRVRLRRATPDDVPYLTALAADPQVEPHLAAVSPWTEDELRDAIAAGGREPASAGRFVVEVAGEGGWARAGGLAFAVQNRRSRIAYLFGVMVDAGARRRGAATEAVRLLALHLVRDLGYHRVQLEVYGFNEAGLRLFERAGFVREGVRRRAYWRHGAWQDGVLFGLTEEDLGE
jgi:RimJ/RimL family protein N-acetyltransferase